MGQEKYSTIWFSLVQIRAKDGNDFNSLIDIEQQPEQDYVGAYGNILVKCETIHDVLNIIPAGLNELGFELASIDKIENFRTLVEANEIKESVIIEADWLLKSVFVFKISDRIFPYLAE